MDEKLRTLERRALAGDPEATEALLKEQERLGLYSRQHFVYGLPLIMLTAGGVSRPDIKFLFNYEIHFISMVSSGPFSWFIVDDLGNWSNQEIHSQCLAISGKYELLVPRFIPKDSEMFLEFTDRSLQSNHIHFSFHGIRTVAKEFVHSC